MHINFKDNRIEVKESLQGKITKFLVEASELICSQTASNSRVKTGQTKRSWKTQVNESENEAKIGSELENSIYEEFGTGEFALEGNGRKSSWVYKDKITGKFYKTKGKRPIRALYKAFTSQKSNIIKKAEEILKELN